MAEAIEMLTSHEGNEYPFKVVKPFSAYGKRYVSLAPADLSNVPEGWGEDDIIILRVDTVDGEQRLVEIADAHEYDRACDAFDLLMPSGEVN